MQRSDLPSSSEFSPTRIDLLVLLNLADQHGTNWKVFESSRLAFSRLQMQRKNTSHVALADIAKEVGLTHFLKDNTIIMVSTGEIGGEARYYTNKILGESNLCIVMLYGNVFAHIEVRSAVIVDVLPREARHTTDLKKLDI